MKKSELTENTIENNPRHLRASARELLKAAKIAEAQRMSNGAVWERRDGKTWVLKNNSGEASNDSL